jgi:COP9 signalosome complex subunit 7
VNATLDPYHQLVAVSSVAPLRDLQPNTIPQMLVTLDEWSNRCVSTLGDLERQIASIKAEAKRRHREEEEWAAHVEKLIETKVNEKDKGKEKESSEDKNYSGISSGLFSRIPKLGAGAASKRGMDGDDEAMEIDDDDDDGERRGSRSAKKRGFGLLGSNK